MNDLKAGVFMHHRVFGKGFVTQCFHEDGCVFMYIDFNDGQGRRNIMIQSNSELNTYFDMSITYD